MCDTCNRKKLAEVRAACDVFIKGAELPWAKEYTQDNKHFDNLLVWAAELERQVVKYFKKLLPIVDKVTWDKYEVKQSAEGDRDWTVNIDFVNDGYDDTFIEFVYEPIQQMELAGLFALEAAAPVKVPTANLEAKITEAVTKYAAKLVTQIDDYTRERINAIVNQAMGKGLTKKQAAGLLEDFITDPYRAEMIAHTESVKAYSRGREAYADESGAIAHEWHTQSGVPCDNCLSCEADGEIPIDQSFGPGWSSPDSSHPNCYCYVSYVYPTD